MKLGLMIDEDNKTIEDYVKMVFLASLVYNFSF